MMISVLTELLRVAPVTIVGAIAAYVAWQQWKTNQQRLRLDLYERRLRIYKEVQGFIASASHGQPGDLAAFTRATAEADFLFGPCPNPITLYLDELFLHGLELSKWKQDHRDATRKAPADYDHQAVVSGIDAENRWFKEQGDAALGHFGEYLNLRG